MILHPLQLFPSHSTEHSAHGLGRRRHGGKTTACFMAFVTQYKLCPSIITVEYNRGRLGHNIIVMYINFRLNCELACRVTYIYGMRN